MRETSAREREIEREREGERERGRETLTHAELSSYILFDLIIKVLMAL